MEHKIPCFIDTLPKPPEAVRYDKEGEQLTKEGLALMEIQDNISKEKEDNRKEIINIDLEINQAKRDIHLKQKWFKLRGWFTSAGCGEMPGPDASVYVLKAYYDCLFDKSNPNPDPLPAPRPTWKAIPNEKAGPNGSLWEFSPEQKKKMQTQTPVPPPTQQTEKPGISDQLKNFLNNVKKRRFDVRIFTSPATVRG